MLVIIALISLEFLFFFYVGHIFFIGTVYAMEPFNDSEINGFANISYNAFPAYIKKGHYIPCMIQLGRDMDIPISSILFPELADYARFRKDSLPFLGTIFNRHIVPVEIGMRIINLCYGK